MMNMYITILIISIIHSQQNLNNPKEKLRGQHRPIVVFSFGECFVEKMLNGYKSVYKCVRISIHQINRFSSILKPYVI